ncbi:MAG: hypothetical protein ISS49_11515 [Anaerolineae bacterium]|jgi:hypothetical protein|nr:hypothetical protein [Anaerolineae bacterium]
MRMECTGENERGGRLGGRLKGVRKRRRSRRGFECEVMALKLRLVRAKEKDGR